MSAASRSEPAPAPGVHAAPAQGWARSLAGPARSLVARAVVGAPLVWGSGCGAAATTSDRTAVDDTPGGAAAETASTGPVAVDGSPGDVDPGTVDPSSIAPGGVDPGGVDPGTPAVGARATYRVPVPAELEPYASFELGDLRFREREGQVNLEYSLPVLLVGGTQRVSFRGPLLASGELDLNGEAGRVTCRAVGSSMQCDEVLTQVELDQQKLERALSAFTSDESQARRAVAARFSDDPIGVLTFPR